MHGKSSPLGWKVAAPSWLLTSFAPAGIVSPSAAGSSLKTTTRNVKRWRDGTMIKRWVAAGMLNAERSFRRVKGCKDMPASLPLLPVTSGASHPRRENQDVA